jgi:hypothetical protein
MTNKPISHDTLLNELQWCHATKQFDRARAAGDKCGTLRKVCFGSEEIITHIA